MDFDEIEEEILRKISPDEEELDRLDKIVKELKVKVIEAAQKLGADVKPFLVGSVARGTALKNLDIDFFILFPKNTERKKLEELGLGIGETVLKEGEKRYAEHPYIRGNYNGFDVEIVPCYEITDSSQKMSAVDRTPFHTRYVIEHLRDEQRGQVRLLKRFLKGIGAYGAEAEVQGFSGYLTELLIIKHGNFRSLLESAKTWKKGHIISLKDDKRKHKDFTEPLVVIDPVDPNRNVAAALSLETLSLFIHASMEYLKAPSMLFFFPNELTPLSKEELIKKMDERGSLIAAVLFKSPDVVDDVLFPQVRKCEKTLVKVCEEHDFGVYKSSFFVDENVIILLEFHTHTLSNIKRHWGPPVWHGRREDFLARWSDGEGKGPVKRASRPYISEGKWAVDIWREYTSPIELLRTEIPNLNLGKDINSSIKNHFEVLEAEEFLGSGCDKVYQSRKRLTRFLDDRYPWQY